MLFDYFKIAEFRSQFPEVKYHYGKCPLWVTKPELILAPPDQNFNFKFNYMVACSLKYAIFRKKVHSKLFEYEFRESRWLHTKNLPTYSNAHANAKKRNFPARLPGNWFKLGIISTIFEALQSEPFRIKVLFLNSKFEKNLWIQPTYLTREKISVLNKQLWTTVTVKTCFIFNRISSIKYVFEQI